MHKVTPLRACFVLAALIVFAHTNGDACCLVAGCALAPAPQSDVLNSSSCRHCRPCKSLGLLLPSSQVRALAKRLSAAESELQSAVLDDFKLLLGTVDVKTQEALKASFQDDHFWGAFEPQLSHPRPSSNLVSSPGSSYARPIDAQGVPREPGALGGWLPGGRCPGPQGAFPDPLQSALSSLVVSLLDGVCALAFVCIPTYASVTCRNGCAYKCAWSLPCCSATEGRCAVTTFFRTRSGTHALVPFTHCVCVCRTGYACR
eukprot:1158781-Pelagomonas_calceolata.AAC.2